MTKRNKIVLGSSIFLSLCVIATVIINLKYKIQNSDINTNSLILIGIIILLSIISIPVVYFLKVRKSKFERMLNNEYFQKYEIIKDAVMNSQLSGINKKEIKEDILDILISAQKSGKPAEDTVGNPETFAGEIILSYARPGRLPVLSIMDGIMYFILFIMGVNIFMWFEQTNVSFFKTGIDISIITFLFIISFILIPVTKKLASTHNYWMFILPVASGIVFVLFAEITRRFFYSNEIIRQFLDGTVRMVPNIFILILYIVLIPIILFFKSYVRRQLLKTID
ncbi:MAG: hypothetical protein PHQ09_04820 [Actinomycetota bacterium]|nr:hypothetical protein [Actinomycetota bacterium]